MSTKTSAKISMYRLHELGDCFLLTFNAGADRSHMLVDCGSFRNSSESVARLEAITAAIGDTLDGKPLDVVVATHQHNDHVSGFLHCETTFRKIGIGQVWLSWLDNPRDRMAQRIGADHNNLKLKLAAAHKALHAAVKNKNKRPVAARSLEVLHDVLGFYGGKSAGAPPEVPAKAVRLLERIGEQKPRYLKPGQSVDVPGLPAGAVRVHVLGPPKDDDLLYRKDPREGESYDHALAAAGMLAARFLDASNKRDGDESRDEEQYPFNESYTRSASTTRSKALAALMQRYKRRADAWRTIDDDWMQQAEALALYLDTFTNNSSLVLAIELVQSGKVLLFAADAQTGNWLSWKDVKWEDKSVRTDDLLARTVFYKVGHHASHNATLVEVFEKLRHPDLVAMIPVHKKDPNITKVNGWKMPARNLFRKLVEHADHRVLQMDNVNPASCNPARHPANKAWKRAGMTPRVTDSVVEVEIAG